MSQSRKKFCLSGFSLLITTDDSLSPTNQKPQIPNTKYHRNASDKSFEGTLKFPSEGS